MKTAKLRNLCRIKYGKDHKYLGDGKVPVYGSGGIVRYVDKALSEGPSVLIPRKGTLGNLFYADGPFWTIDTLFWTEIEAEKVLPRYFYYALRTIDLAGLNVGTAVPSLTTEVLYNVEIPLLNMKKQEQIVRLLESFDQKVELNARINGCLAA